MNVDSIQNCIVIDHITEGMGLRLYQMLELDKGEKSGSVALLQSLKSGKYGRKDLIKIEGEAIPPRISILGYIDPQITVNMIRDGRIIRKESTVLPKRLVNVIRCTNPRCITSTEAGCDHIFNLTHSGRYRCIYCNAEFHSAASK